MINEEQGLERKEGGAVKVGPRRIILIGMKSSGKTATGRALARRLGLRFIDMDWEIERRHFAAKGEKLRFREIFQRYGKDYFRALETEALRAVAAGRAAQPFVMATGGGLPLAEENRALLRQLGTVVFLDTAEDVMLQRIVARGIPAFFPYPDDPRKSLAELMQTRRPVYRALANVTVECQAESLDALVQTILTRLEHACEN